MSLSSTLGYSDDSQEPVVPVGRQAEVASILSQLEAIDTQISTALPDSLAVKVGDLGLDYQQHLGILRAQGSLLLKRLSALVGLPIAYNRFTGEVPPAAGSNALSVRYTW